jgi:hypothetical protein
VPDVLTLDPVPPGPRGALTVSVHCCTARTGGAGVHHDVTINADWTLTAPHDLDLERIGVAMGGYLSCVELADTVLPALRSLVQLTARRELPEMARESDGRWRLPCPCMPNVHATAAFAADHARDLAHVMQWWNVRRLPLARLFDQVMVARDGTIARCPAGARPLVREFDGVERLWEAGIHPELIARLHALLWPDAPAMPAWFYLGAVMRRPDLDWLAATLRKIPDEDVAVWMCWTETDLDRRHPLARQAWIRAGVPRPAIVGLLDGEYTPADVARLAARSQRTIAGAAVTFAAWAEAGCHPSVDDIVVLDELDVDPLYRPSSGTVSWLHRHSRLGISRTQAALVLAICGNRRSALQLLDHGITDLRTVAAQVRPEVMA